MARSASRSGSMISQRNTITHNAISATLTTGVERVGLSSRSGIIAAAAASSRPERWSRRARRERGARPRLLAHRARLLVRLVGNVVLDDPRGGKIFGERSAATLHRQWHAALLRRDLAHRVVVDLDRAGAARTLERGREHPLGLGVEIARVFRKRPMHFEV